MNMEPVPVRTEIRIIVELMPRTPFPLEDVRVVITNYLIALKENGQLIGAIIDLETKPASEVVKDLRSVFHGFGIQFSKNPFTPDDSGLYRQSLQIPIYRNLLYKMLCEEKACLAPCSDKKRLEIFQNSGTKSKTSSLTEGSTLPVAEVNFSGDAPFGFEVFLAPDLVMSKKLTETEMGSVPGPIKLWNADGKPSVHFANCVDRHLLGISHVAC